MCRKAQGEVILFVDELHTLVGAGAAEGAIDASNILKPSLARGELQCIGATTLDEYRKYVERDAALERRFAPILVSEPTVEQTVEILRGLRDRYEAHHGVKIGDDALVAAATLADKYISDRFLPDKAIDLMDEAASKIRLQASFLPQEVRQALEKAERSRTRSCCSTRSRRRTRMCSTSSSDPRGWAPDGRSRPHGGFPARGYHHDEQPGEPVPPQLGS